MGKKNHDYYFFCIAQPCINTINIIHSFNIKNHTLEHVYKLKIQMQDKLSCVMPNTNALECN